MSLLLPLDRAPPYRPKIAVGDPNKGVDDPLARHFVPPTFCPRVASDLLPVMFDIVKMRFGVAPWRGATHCESRSCTRWDALPPVTIAPPAALRDGLRTGVLRSSAK